MSEYDHKVIAMVMKDPRYAAKFRDDPQGFDRFILDRNPALASRYWKSQERINWMKRGESYYIEQRKLEKKRDLELAEMKERDKKRKRRANKKRHRPSKGRTERRTKARFEEFRQDVMYERRVQYGLRHVGSSIENYANIMSKYPYPVSPLLSVSELHQRHMVSKLVIGFYDQNVGDNKYLKIRPRLNMANMYIFKDNGQWGVEAKIDIEPNTVLCPYLGEIVTKPRKGARYIAQIVPGTYVDAERFKYDVGYIYDKCPKGYRSKPSARAGLRRYNPNPISAIDDPERELEPGKCPPNYARYINSINFNDPLQAKSFTRDSLNCRLEGDPSGLDALFVVSSCFIHAGDELLLDYGPAFQWSSSDAYVPGDL